MTETPCDWNYNIDAIRPFLPKDYRLRTHFADLEGPVELVSGNLDHTFIQHSQARPAKFLGLIPYTRRVWVDIAEVTPSLVGIGLTPFVVVYKKFKHHLTTISDALKKTPFIVVLEGTV